MKISFGRAMMLALAVIGMLAIIVTGATSPENIKENFPLASAAVGLCTGTIAHVCSYGILSRIDQPTELTVTLRTENHRRDVHDTNHLTSWTNIDTYAPDSPPYKPHASHLLGHRPLAAGIG